MNWIAAFGIGAFIALLAFFPWKVLLVLLAWTVTALVASYFFDWWFDI